MYVQITTHGCAILAAPIPKTHGLGLVWRCLIFFHPTSKAHRAVPSLRALRALQAVGEAAALPVPLLLLRPLQGGARAAAAGSAAGRQGYAQPLPQPHPRGAIPRGVTQVLAVTLEVTQEVAEKVTQGIAAVRKKDLA